MRFDLNRITEQLTKRVAGALVAAAVVIGGVSFTLGQSINSTSDVKIAAQKVEDGRIEFALEQDGELIKPASRYFPAEAEVGIWHKSSTVPVVQSEVMSPDGVSVVAIPVPQYRFVTQSLIDRAAASRTGWATQKRSDGWFVAVDTNGLEPDEDYLDPKINIWMCKGGYLWWASESDSSWSPHDGRIDFLSLFTNERSLENIRDGSWHGDVSQVIENCSPLRGVDLGSPASVVIPFGDNEPNAPTSTTPGTDETNAETANLWVYLWDDVRYDGSPDIEASVYMFYDVPSFDLTLNVAVGRHSGEFCNSSAIFDGVVNQLGCSGTDVGYSHTQVTSVTATVDGAGYLDPDTHYRCVKQDDSDREESTWACWLRD